MQMTELLHHLGIPVAPSNHHHTRPGWVQFDCPYCGTNSQKFHMGFRIDGGFVNCWKCGPHPLYETVYQLSNKTPEQTKKLLGDLEFKKFKPTEHRGKLVLPKGLGELGKPHRKYLRSRGYDPDLIQQLWKVQGIGIAAKRSWTIFIPIIFKGQTVSWTTRKIVDEDVLRYLSANSKEESYPHKKVLYGEDYARWAISIHEGPLDVWKVGPGATCTFGTGFSRTQIRRMIKYERRIICFDAEEQAQKRARQLMNQLEPFPGETINVILDSKDAGSASKREIRTLRKLLEV